ncbi:hypothetical protein L1987_11147 [Smallanthus sonchifolius]|uniref:Uncharacterized protein n=1 Tax=Smallanthus sonchifolius TaxID=185202 RepID=A0ACB9JAH6_9ASTR|nr:hypothetical protein L1987_11147 [Smallanthus sonchifolius]
MREVLICCKFGESLQSTVYTTDAFEINNNVMYKGKHIMVEMDVSENFWHNVLQMVLTPMSLSSSPSLSSSSSDPANSSVPMAYHAALVADAGVVAPDVRIAAGESNAHNVGSKPDSTDLKPQTYRCRGGQAHVFDQIPDPNIAPWNAMFKGRGMGMAGYAYKVFSEITLRNVVTWTSMISGKLFDVMPNQDLMSWNTLLNGYANNGDMEGCKKLFNEMPEKNLFSWNGLINGYAHNNRFIEVLDAFKMMLNESNVQPNDVTLVSVLSACSKLGALELGKWVHLYAVNNGYKENAYVGNSLIDMYAKCGVITSAVDVFMGMNKKDLISWNTVINGLAMHGHGPEALRIFHDMKNSKQKPDGITFIGVICACSHMGLVKDGFKYFNSMVDEYSIIPQIEHYGCMVDLQSRAGLIEEAVEWADLARSKVAMRNTGAKKSPGCSLIEVDDGVVEFYAFDERHLKTEEIYSALKSLIKLSKDTSYVQELMEHQ